jgi:murein DD-endopeptidase MepM/ murein hydrolase activator NlpD
VILALLACAGPSGAFGARSADTVARDLAATRAKVSTVGRQYDKALNQLENTDYRIRITDQKLAAEAAKLAAAEDLLNSRAAVMYRNGEEVDVTSFLLGATTFDDLVTRADMVSLIGTLDAELIRSVKDTRSNLEANRAKLVQDRKARLSEYTVFKKRRADLAKQLASVQGTYDRLLAEQSAARLREGKKIYPAGPNGMVFPVQGVNYYSDTWGAARSGGRHHKGTDIMARTGTTCVAVLDGTARVHSSGLGGKSITLTANNGWQFYYAHLNGYAISGGRVRAGQVIGYVGSTGNARGGAPHLHFQMGPGGSWINPYSYLRRMQ